MRGQALEPQAYCIVHEQISWLLSSGLWDAAQQIVVGINGPEEESSQYARLVIPKKAQLVFHGQDSFSENLTLITLELWAKQHPGWDVFYHHAKGATHVPGSQKEQEWTRCRDCMTSHLVGDWKRCVKDLRSYDAVGCHWMPGQGSDRSQNIFAGNFWWTTSDFIARLSSILLRDRIRTSGVASLESRWEAEVWLGNGHPRVRDYTNHRYTECL